MTFSATVTQTRTATPTRSVTRSSTPTATPSVTTTLTATPSGTATRTATPTRTPTPTGTATPTRTFTITPTRTRTSTATPTSTSSVTPTTTPSPTPSVCPYSLTDHFPTNTSCFYTGPFNIDPTCPTDLIAAFVSDGTSVVLQLGTVPAVSFGANVTSATSAMLTFYVVEGEIPQPIGGTMDLLNDGRTLVIQPDSTPAIGGIGGAQCSFDLYSGVFKQVFTGP